MIPPLSSVGWFAELEVCPSTQIQLRWSLDTQSRSSYSTPDVQAPRHMNESPSSPGSPWFASSSHQVLLVASESPAGGALSAAEACVCTQIHVRPS